MNNFLTVLYFEYFQSIEEEKRLRNIHDFDSDISNIRNDQKIIDATGYNKKIKKLIEAYIKQLGFITQS